MATFTVTNQHLPARCEICHQADAFDPATGTCTRCAGISVPAPPSRLSEWLSIGQLLVFVICVLLGIVLGAGGGAIGVGRFVSLVLTSGPPTPPPPPGTCPDSPLFLISVAGLLGFLGGGALGGFGVAMIWFCKFGFAFGRRDPFQPAKKSPPE